MKVLLINPPSRQLLVGNNPRFLDEERGYNPPLGLLYIGTALVRESAHQLRILDAMVEEMGYEGLKQEIASERPDVVGITTMSFTLLDVIKVVELVKEVTPEAVVVLGGPHVYLFPDQTIRLPGVDYLVVGEGELAFLEFMEFLEGKRDPSSVSGLVYEENGRIRKNPQAMIENLDEISLPDRTLLPYRKYNSLLFSRTPVTTMFTSRGCPYKCTFCDRPHLGKKFRAHSAGFVLKEMESCLTLGIRDFIIYDDTFTVDRKRVVAICEGILERKWDITWDIRARVNTVDHELLVLMKKAGCQGIHYGIEAGTEKILTVLKKGITIPQASEVFKLTRKLGIRTLGYFMIGSPTETKADIEETFRVARRLDPDFIHLTIFTPFPGTQIYFDGLKQGVISHDVWKEFARNPSPGFIPPHWGEIFTRSELQKMLIAGYKGFYGRPSYILKELMKVKTLDDFKRKARAGLKVLFHKKNEA